MSASSRITPDDVLELEGDGLYELIDGKQVEKKMSYLSSPAAGLMTAALLPYARPNKLGDVLPKQTFMCFPEDPEKIRRPDVAFVLAQRTPAGPTEGHVNVSPDIAIEVISPSEKIYELDEKLEDYRSAGVKLVWVVNPNSRTIRVHRPDHSVTELLEYEMLHGESVLPEFAVRVSDLLTSKKP
jgi:Uma2 family endonuclease